MVRVGILTCTTSSHEIACSSFACLDAAHQRSGFFSQYGEETVQVAGIISCAGCPTKMGIEKIMNRVRALADVGINAIHFSACLTGLCPFRKKYAALIQERYPDLKIVMGTHAMPEGEAGQKLVSSIVNEICAKRLTMVDLVKNSVG